MRTETGIILLVLIAGAGLGRAAGAAEPDIRPATDAAAMPGADRPESAIQALLLRGRLLRDARFQIPLEFYRQYLGDRDRPATETPVPFIAEAGTYRLSVAADRRASLEAELELRIFDPVAAATLPVLDAKLPWEELTVNGKPARLPTVGSFLQFTPDKSGAFVIKAKALLKPSAISGQPSASSLTADSLFAEWAVPRTVKTFVTFDSPGAWQVKVAPGQSLAFSRNAELKGVRELQGTHRQAALTPRDSLRVEYEPAEAGSVRTEKPRYELSGDVVWNFDDAVEQVTASLTATIAGGASDRIDLLLPPAAARVSITGPEVREAQVSAGKATVYLRGGLLGQTALRLSYELPFAAGQPSEPASRNAELRGVRGENSEHSFGRLGVADGYWSGGTLVITSTASAKSEILPSVAADGANGSAAGLKQIPLSQIPTSAAGMLPGPAALAYQIAPRQAALAASVELLQLGEFALRQSIADLAHYELCLDRDGSMICRVKYEIRNRSKQFLTISLPADARVLLARVNEKSCPLSPVVGASPVGATLVVARGRAPLKGPPLQGPAGLPPTGTETFSRNAEGVRVSEPGRWLLQLERSQASVMGLVSFPVELVYVCRVAVPRKQGEAELLLALPQIDLPVAYAWCEAYLPPELLPRADRWAGPLRRVDEFSSQTAKASLDYGSGELAAGYREASRPVVPGRPAATPEKAPTLAKVPIVKRGFGSLAAIISPLTPQAQKVATAPLAGGPGTAFATYDATGGTIRGLAGPTTAPAVGDIKGDHRLSSGETVDVQVYELYEKGRDWLGRHRIDEGGAVALPKIGSLHLAGLTESQAQSAIGKAYREAGLLAEPNVGVAASANSADLPPTRAFGLSGPLNGSGTFNMKGTLDPLMARNYYRTGKDLYDRGDLAAAASNLEQVVKLAPGSVEAENAQRLLANEALLRQPEKYTLKSQSEKAAAIEVQKESAERLNAPDIVQSQEKLVEQARADIQAGKLSEGRTKLEAAQSLGERLGDGSRPLSFQYPTETQNAPANIQQELYALKYQEASQLRGQLDQLKQAGKAQEALEVGKRLRSLEGSNEALNKEVGELAIAAYRQSPGPAAQGQRGGTTPAPTVGFEVHGLVQPSPQQSPAKQSFEPGLYVPDRAAGATAGRAFGGPPPANQAPADQLNRWFSEEVATKEVRWDRTKAAIKDNLTRADEQLTKPDKDLTPDDFAEANRRMDQATRILAGNQDVAVDADFTDLSKELTDRKAQIAVKQERWNANRVAEERNQAVQRQMEESHTVDERFQVRVDKLMNQVLVSRQERDYAAAVRNLQEVLKLDPNNRQAQALLDDSETLNTVYNQRRIDDRQSVENREALLGVREGMTTYDRPVNVPDSGAWREMTERRPAFKAGVPPESQANQRVRDQMRKNVSEIRFQAITFENALNFLRDLQRVNINPNWEAMEAVGITKATEVSLQLRDVTFETALKELLTRVAGREDVLAYLVRDGVINISSKDDLEKQTYIQVYDVRDLIHPLLDFRAPVTAQNQQGQANSVLAQNQQNQANNAANGGGNRARGGGLFGAGDTTGGEKTAAETRAQMVKNFTDLLKATVAPESWAGTGNDIREDGDGLLVVKQTPEGQKRLAELISQLQGAQGPQVELGGRIARQRVNLNLEEPWDYPMNVNTAARVIEEGTRHNLAADPELRKFIDRNYEWELIGRKPADGDPRALLIDKLDTNLGQKVVVNSRNLGLPAAAARALGANFVAGRNGVAAAVIDEAQFRSLVELDAAGEKVEAGRRIEANDTLQETIVGTDARLANGGLARVSFAAERGNTLDVNGNAAELPHGRYLLIDNGAFLTAVRAGPMHHWTEGPNPAEVEFFQVPQTIEPLRVGRLVRFEKALLAPGDRPVLRAR